MMKIDGRKCDRCGKLYDNREVKEPEYILTRRSMSNNSEIDICPSCAEDLKRWFEDSRKLV